MLMQGAGMVKGVTAGEISQAFMNGGKVTEEWLDRWTPNNINASYPVLHWVVLVEIIWLHHFGFKMLLI